MSETFRYEPMACIRVEGGDVYYLRDWPTERQKLINKMVSDVHKFSVTELAFLEAYDTRGNMHLINTNYIIDIYIDEKAYLRKEETR